MRALVVGPAAAWSTADVFHGWVQGLTECGVQVESFDLMNRLVYYGQAAIYDTELTTVEKRLTVAEAHQAVTEDLFGAVYKYQPDVVFIVHGANVDWAMVAEIRVPVVLILTECPYENENQLVMAAAAEPSLILVNDPTDASVFETVAPTFYLPHAYDPKVHYPGTPSRDCVFVGTGFDNRIDFMSRVDWSGIDLELGGMWAKAEGTILEPYIIHPGDLAGCVENTATADMYRNSRTSFNIYRADSHGDHSTADGWAMGPRETELAACGTWFARQSRPEGDELFPMLPVFEDPEELGDILRWALTHETERAAAAAQAHAAIVDRTFAGNAHRALARL